MNYLKNLEEEEEQEEEKEEEEPESKKEPKKEMKEVMNQETLKMFYLNTYKNTRQQRLFLAQQDQWVLR